MKQSTHFLLSSLSIFAFSASIYAGGEIEPIYNKTLEPVIDLPIMEHNSFEQTSFVFLNAGASIFSIDSYEEPRAHFADGVFSNKGGMMEIGAGYNFSQNIFSTLAYQAIFLDKASLNNFYASINYKFNNDELVDVYLGAILGVSSMTWDSDPHLVLIDKSLTSESMIYGFQTGIAKKINENVSLTAKYEIMKYNHEIDVRQGRSDIKHKLGQNILVGAQYEF